VEMRTQAEQGGRGREKGERKIKEVHAKERRHDGEIAPERKTFSAGWGTVESIQWPNEKKKVKGEKGEAEQETTRRSNPQAKKKVSGRAMPTKAERGANGGPRK